MASVHKFWYFLIVIHSFSLTNFNFQTKLYTRDFQKINGLVSLLGTAHGHFRKFCKINAASLSELRVLPSFCFAFKIPDDVAASIHQKPPKKYVRGESKIKGGGLRMFNKFNDLKQFFISSKVPFALRGLEMHG